MQSCIILGSGRSGTSMTAGLLSAAGYYFGPDMLPSDEANPKGFFESPTINGLNEVLISKVVPGRLPRPFHKRFFRTRTRRGQRWLARVPVGTIIPAPTRIVNRIREETAHRPFCFKDPRFSYTLPIWEPYIEDALRICVFRDPMTTLDSILRQFKRARHLQDLKMSEQEVLDVWLLMYRHILERHRHQGEWLFVQFDQILDRSAFPSISRRLGVELDRTFPDVALRRSSRISIPGLPTPEVLEVYRQLSELAASDRSA